MQIFKAYIYPCKLNAGVTYPRRIYQRGDWSVLTRHADVMSQFWHDIEGYIKYLENKLARNQNDSYNCTVLLPGQHVSRQYSTLAAPYIPSPCTYQTDQSGAVQMSNKQINRAEQRDKQTQSYADRENRHISKVQISRVPCTCQINR